MLTSIGAATPDRAFRAAFEARKPAIAIHDLDDWTIDDTTAQLDADWQPEPHGGQRKGFREDLATAETNDGRWCIMSTGGKSGAAATVLLPGPADAVCERGNEHGWPHVCESWGDLMIHGAVWTHAVSESAARRCMQGLGCEHVAASNWAEHMPSHLRTAERVPWGRGKMVTAPSTGISAISTARTFRARNVWWLTDDPDIAAIVLAMVSTAPDTHDNVVQWLTETERHLQSAPSGTPSKTGR